MKTFECTLVHKVDGHTKIDFIESNDAVAASAAIQKLNPDWICKFADVIDDCCSKKS